MLQAGAALLTAVSLPSCNGIFEGIYDEPSVIDEFGFTKVEQATSSGTIYIDATSYTRWNYLDFETFALDTTFIAEDGSETGDVTEGWDFAVHRYDVKTNGGRVIETSFTSIDALLASGSMPQGTWVEDIWTEDRKWLNVDTSTMPPVYTMSGKVYVLITAEGKAAAIQLINYMNDSKVKGFMTIDYVYPLEF